MRTQELEELAAMGQISSEQAETLAYRQKAEKDRREQAAFVRPPKRRKSR